MAKKVLSIIKLALPAGKATPAPPVGPVLGQHGLNIMMFCKEYNARTGDQAVLIIPIDISVFEARRFSFILKAPTASVLLNKAVGIEKGSGEPNRIKVGEVTREQLEEIAKKKLPDLNTQKIDQAVRIIEGTARSMGLTIVD